MKIEERTFKTIGGHSRVEAPNYWKTVASKTKIILYGPCAHMAWWKSKSYNYDKIKYKILQDSYGKKLK